ncbi:MAG: D-glucuronyl C5-epimerase family protein [FCB group bacterium]|nr:D-glucuronyl C5-epimerase family protein [FCB group bacterium]
MKNNQIANYFLSILMMQIFIGCFGLWENTDLNDNHYSFRNLDYHELYYTYGPTYFDINEPFNYLADDSGVVISEYGGMRYYNPINICFKGINFYDRYVNVQDSLYLDYANKHRDALIRLMNEDYLFEYKINYYHYGVLFRKPWCSGMAQGVALSFLSRLAYYANDTLSENVAHKVFETLNPYSSLGDAVIDIDPSLYAWIEEYPGDPPDRTLNGFLHAIIGIYDYYHLINTQKQIADILSVYTTTINDHMYEYRNPGGISYYCLNYYQTYRDYHKIHCDQLNFLTKITQDSSFAIFADTLKMDYWEW